MTHALKVFTSRIWLKDPDAFDITRGNGGEAAAPFAPSKAILLPALEARTRAKMLHPEAARAVLQVAWKRYAEQYRAEMEMSHGALYRSKKWADLTEIQREAWHNGARPHPEAWDALLARDRVVLTCYCPLDVRLPATELLARGQCHRVLLAGYLAACGAVYCGEIALPRARRAA